VCRAVAALGTIQCVTLIFGASTCKEDAWFPGTKSKLVAERAVQNSGVPFTIFRCTMFIELLPKMMRENRALIFGQQTTASHFVAAGDYAKIVSKALLTHEAANKIFMSWVLKLSHLRKHLGFMHQM